MAYVRLDWAIENRVPSSSIFPDGINESRYASRDEWRRMRTSHKWNSSNFSCLKKFLRVISKKNTVDPGPPNQGKALWNIVSVRLCAIGFRTTNVVWKKVRRFVDASLESSKGEVSQALKWIMGRWAARIADKCVVVFLNHSWYWPSGEQNLKMLLTCASACFPTEEGPPDCINAPRNRLSDLPPKASICKATDTAPADWPQLRKTHKSS